MVLNLCSIYTPKHACSSVIYLGIFKLWTFVFFKDYKSIWRLTDWLNRHSKLINNWFDIPYPPPRPLIPTNVWPPFCIAWQWPYVGPRASSVVGKMSQHQKKNIVLLRKCVCLSVCLCVWMRETEREREHTFKMLYSNIRNVCKSMIFSVIL